jgi:hypothetical protein
MTQNTFRDLAIILVALGVVALSLVVVFQYVAMPSLDLWSSATLFATVCLLLIAFHALGFIGLLCIAVPILQLIWTKLDNRNN